MTRIVRVTSDLPPARCWTVALVVGSARPVVRSSGRSWVAPLFRRPSRRDCPTGGSSLLPRTAAVRPSVAAGGAHCVEDSSRRRASAACCTPVAAAEACQRCTAVSSRSLSSPSSACGSQPRQPAPGLEQPGRVPALQQPSGLGDAVAAAACLPEERLHSGPKERKHHQLERRLVVRWCSLLVVAAAVSSARPPMPFSAWRTRWVHSESRAGRHRSEK